jgi:hypothetical protein
MEINSNNKRYAIISMVIFSLIMITITFSFQGTGDEGDSIYHYLYARYAPIHPDNFFNHWAKPLYVLLMCPFAQFGFIGAKIFNALLSCVSVWFTYLIARSMNYKWSLMVFPLALFFRLFMVFTFSGLTEPMSNAILAIAIYLAVKGKYYYAAIIISFLPFIRSEGLFMCGVFGLYLLWLRQWRAIPLLLLGHIVYSIAGYPYYHQLLWVFTQIPYATTTQHYGHGTWTYFAEQMPAITGIVGAVLLTLGCVVTLYISANLVIKKDIKNIPINALFLVAMFLVFFLMHTTFWALGIFASFGMIRVFVAISCVMILIMLSAFEFLDSHLSSHLRYHGIIMVVLFVGISSAFAFSSSHYSYSSWDFGLHPDEIRDREIVSVIKQKYPDYKSYHYYFDAMFIATELDVDVYGPQFCFNDHLEPAGAYPPKSIVIWDDWYSNFEHGTKLESLQQNPLLKEITTVEKTNPWGGMRKAVLFIRE